MNVNIGDIIEISRRGDVIPHIEKIITKINSGHVAIPTHCPSCHTKLIVEDKFLHCPNPQCLSQIIGSLNLFCQTLEILGLSDKTIQKLYHSGRIKLPGDFFKLKVADIQDLDNLGEKSAKNIIYQIQSKKVLSVVEVFDAAIIPHFSRKRIQQLITAGFDTPEKLLNLQESELLNIKGFQTTLAQKIIIGISQRRSWIESILSNVSLKNISLKNGKLNGLTFCITGDLSHPRKDIEKLIEANGGQVMSSVSANTSYLLTNETSSNSSKFVTAQKLNIPIINEESFSNLIK
jgi:DNA ligase (NAD+)